MIPLRTIWKIFRHVGIFLLLGGGSFWAISLLPSPWNGIFGIVLAVFFLGLALYFLDMMVPGVNVFSFAPHRLPKPYASGHIALTFDDGPSDPYTLEILDILDQFDVKAMFFCIGENVQKHPEIAKAIFERGHEVAVHSMTHRVLPKLGKHEIQDEIVQATKVIQDICGEPPKFFRCPKGFKSRTVERIVKASNQKMIGFSYPLYDVENPPPQEIVDRALNRIREGDILLMHDGFAANKPGRRDSLVSALPKILRGIQEKGLSVISLRDVWT